ncbi:MAG: FtsQ-type POTRA domain-containing protein [Clostridia bacterium]|nr:FtsQ-type POTRA domain-containing protein [Clostridia bacterium]
MKKKRIYIIISIMLIFIFILSLSSAVFELKTVEICFFSQENVKIKIVDNTIFNTTNSVDAIISSADFEYGKLMFLQQKDKYIINLERNNPYLETLDLEVVFPNKFVINARERVATFYIQYEEKSFLLDKDYKILEIVDNLLVSELVPITFEKDRNSNSFFSFFSLSPLAFSQSQFLSENNLVFSSLNLWTYLRSFSLTNQISNINIKLENGTVFAEISTKTSSYGIKLVVKDILKDFEKKIYKLLNAFKTLEENERIKTTYGQLLIDELCNCFWNNLYV